MDIQSCKNLQALIDKDNNIELIEIWANILYLRMRKGKNKFCSKKRITNLKEGVYLNIYTFSKNEYKQLQQKYHPDTSSKYLHISKSLNQWKDLLSRCDYRVQNRSIYLDIAATYSNNPSIFSIEKSIRIFSMAKEARLFDGLLEDTAEWAEGCDEAWLAQQRAESQSRWKEWSNWQRGRDKEGNKIRDTYDGTLPF